MSIDIKGIDKAELLRCLHNSINSVGMGRLHDLGRDMTYEEAQKVLAHYKREGKEEYYFDYICGRPIKMAFIDDIIRNEQLFDEMWGAGAAQKIVNEILERMTQPKAEPKEQPVGLPRLSAEELSEMLNKYNDDAMGWNKLQAELLSIKEKKNVDALLELHQDRAKLIAERFKKLCGYVPDVPGVDKTFGEIIQDHERFIVIDMVTKKVNSFALLLPPGASSPGGYHKQGDMDTMPL